MGLPNLANISCLRGDPLQLLVRVNGVDLTNAVVSFAVGINRDPVGRSWVLTSPVAKGVEGIRFVRSDTDDLGILFSIFEIIASKAKVAALPRPAEFGADMVLFYDLQSSILNIGGDASEQEVTLARGYFIVKGSIND